jgi:hypothetical protein
MGMIRILGLGIAATAVFGALVAVHQWQAKLETTEGRRVLRELTPGMLISACGPPESDETAYVNAFMNNGVTRIAVSREIKYETEHGWAKLSFRNVPDKSWRLIFFASPEVGVDAAAENAYIALPYLPCLARTVRPFRAFGL